MPVKHTKTINGRSGQVCCPDLGWTLINSMGSMRILLDTAGVGAELLLPVSFWLHQRSTTVFTDFGSGNAWITMDMGSDRPGWQSQRCGNHGRTVSL